MKHFKEKLAGNTNKEFEKKLIEKADSEELTPSEKVQYEALIRRIRKKRVIVNQVIIYMLFIIGLMSAVLFIKYGDLEDLSLAVPNQKVTYYKVRQFPNKTCEELMRQLSGYIERSNNVNAIYNEAIRQYNAGNSISRDYIMQLEALEGSNREGSFQELDKLYEDVLNKKKQILAQLITNNHNNYKAIVLMNEIKHLNTAYTKTIMGILENENIKSECTSEGIVIYE